MAVFFGEDTRSEFCGFCNFLLEEGVAGGFRPEKLFDLERVCVLDEVDADQRFRFPSPWLIILFDREGRREAMAFVGGAAFSSGVDLVGPIDDDRRKEDDGRGCVEILEEEFREETELLVLWRGRVRDANNVSSCCMTLSGWGGIYSEVKFA